MIRAYLRVSSDSQDAESQRHAIERWVGVYGQGEQVIWYEETAQGDAPIRPVYRQLLNEVRKGETVIVWALDRLSREGIVPVLSTMQEFGAVGVRLVSISEPWVDSNNPAAEVVVAVLAWSAQMEKKRIKARQAAGIQAAKASGKTWGGRKKGQMQKRTEEIDEAVRKMHGDGQPVAAIARLVKLSRPTIYEILQG